VDINIHPAKTEIRFHQEGVIKDLIYKTIREELNRYNLVPTQGIEDKFVTRYNTRNKPEVGLTGLSVKATDIPQEKPLKKDVNVAEQTKIGLGSVVGNVSGGKLKAETTVRSESHESINNIAEDKVSMQNVSQMKDPSTDIQKPITAERKPSNYNYNASGTSKSYEEQKEDKAKIKAYLDNMKQVTSGNSPASTSTTTTENAVGENEIIKADSTEPEVIAPKVDTTAAGEMDFGFADDLIRPTKEPEQPKIENNIVEDDIFGAHEQISLIREDKAYDANSTDSYDTIAETAILEEQASIYDDLQYVGQMFRTYLMFEKDNEMYLIDQHAAHEKILYEEFMAAYQESKIISQILLDPIILELSYLDKNKVLSNIKIFDKLGFAVEDFGKNALIVREVPTMFTIPVSKDFILEMINRINPEIKSNYEMMVNSVITMSCKKAIKANQRVDALEVESLIKSLKKLNDPYTCPHGRPIIISIKKYELEKKFKRV